MRSIISAVNTQFVG